MEGQKHQPTFFPAAKLGIIQFAIFKIKEGEEENRDVWSLFM